VSWCRFGYSRRREPILWVRPQLKNYATLNVEQEILMHVLMVEQGIRAMPPDVTEFVIVADSSNLGVKQISLPLMKVRELCRDRRLSALACCGRQFLSLLPSLFGDVYLSTSPVLFVVHGLSIS
jgi:hypothetical protein